MANTSAKPLSLLSKYTRDKYIWGLVYLQVFYWFSGHASTLVLAIIEACLGVYGSEKLLLKLLGAEILRESRTLGIGAFSTTREHGRVLPHNVHPTPCVPLSHAGHLDVPGD